MVWRPIILYSHDSQALKPSSWTDLAYASSGEGCRVLHSMAWEVGKGSFERSGGFRGTSMLQHKCHGNTSSRSIAGWFQRFWLVSRVETWTTNQVCFTSRHFWVLAVTLAKLPASGSPQRWSPCECAESGDHHPMENHGKYWNQTHVKTCQNTDQQWQLVGPWRHGDPSTTFFLESFFSAGSLEGWQNHCKARARTGCSRPQLPHTGRLRWLRKWAPHLMIQNEEVFS